MVGEQTLSGAVPGQRAVADDAARVSDYSLHLRATLGRLCRELVEAVEEGEGGLCELGRLHTWLRADFVPWTARRLRALDRSTRDTLADALTEVGRLDGRLVTTAGREAARTADQLRRVGTDLVSRLIDME